MILFIYVIVGFAGDMRSTKCILVYFLLFKFVRCRVFN